MAVADKTNYGEIVREWYEKPRPAADNFITKYSAPAEATTTRVLWYNNGPWKRTIV